MPLAKEMKNKVINALIGLSTLGDRQTCYVGLFKDTLTGEESATELGQKEVPFHNDSATSGNICGYHRVMLTNRGSSGHYDTKMTTATQGESHNKLPVMFFKPASDETEGWGEIKAVAFFSGETSYSDYIAYSNLETPVTINSNTIANFDVNTLTVKFEEPTLD